VSILVDANTQVLVQGVTGRIARVQTRYMFEAGTRVVAGVTPGKGGETVEGIPVFDTVSEVVRELQIDASVLFVPVDAAFDSVDEAVVNGIKLVVLITEHIPVHDVMKMRALAMENEAKLIGPTTPGIITPGQCKVGILPANMFCPGPVGIISRSGTLSYEVAADLCARRIGQSTVVGMGADMIVGTNLIDLLSLFNQDDATELVVVVGEVGGSQEEDAAAYIAKEMAKPVVAYVAGASVPPGRRMGHAGAIVERETGSAESKVKALAAAGIHVALRLYEIPVIVERLLRQQRCL
jgi:succinyl-CoA synthetase alpha subunit